MDNQVDAVRSSQGFLTIAETLALRETDNVILDPYSTLISKSVRIGRGNVLYPNTILQQVGDSTITVGNNNTFYPQTLILASAGSVTIGDGNEFGAAGCTIKATMPEAAITIGNDGRYCDGVSIMGKTSLGNGSQVLGNITVQGCTLAEGGNFTEPDPDKRASVLKGFGLARGISLEVGQVVNGAGNFADAPVEWQRAYHPKAKA